MCRLLGYVGEPISLDTLLLDAPWSLRRQAHAPRQQDVGRINADGWGVGWYDHTVGPRAARYRTATPMWADQRFEGIAPFLRAGHFVAAVRNASPGLPVEDSGNSPFVADQWLFTHNGFVSNWHDGVGWQLRRGLSERREMTVTGRSDSEVVFAMILDLIDKGVPPDDAMRITIAELHDMAGGRFNLVLTDGTTMFATRDNNTLFLRDTGSARIVASEPIDDDEGWTEVPEHSVVTLTVDAMAVTDL